MITINNWYIVSQPTFFDGHTEHLCGIDELGKPFMSDPINMINKTYGTVTTMNATYKLGKKKESE